jgi:hypothetical protein
MFRSKSDFKILTEAAVINGRLELLSNSWLKSSLKDSFMMKQFGAFSLFCGHFVLNLNETEIVICVISHLIRVQDYFVYY